jgi:lipoate-protein ligase B
MPEITLLPGLAPYAETLGLMEARAAAISAGTAPEAIWLLEHPPLYTAGTSAKPEDLTDPTRFPVFNAGRGGQYTYHGPGQRVAYVMLDLNQRGRDVRQFVCALEAWVIGTLATFNVKGERRPGRVGVWVTRPDRAPNSGVLDSGAPNSGTPNSGAPSPRALNLGAANHDLPNRNGLGTGSPRLNPDGSTAGAPDPDALGTPVPNRAAPDPSAPSFALPLREDKIAAIGVKLRRWVSFHGISINVEPDLTHFTGIVPCGIRDHGVTSLVDLGLPVTLSDLDAALIAEFPKHFPG